MGNTVTSTSRKIPMRRWWILIPTFFLVNFFCGLDRSVISMALPGGMQEELALQASMSGMITGITAIGLMVLAVPAGQIAQRGKLKKIVAICIFGWSMCSIVTAFAPNEPTLLIVRFLLGVCEGIVSPGLTTLLTFWFPDKNGERNRAQTAYLQSSAIASVVMGPLSGAILSMTTWRELFIIVGGISLFALVLWVIFAKDRPAQAKWLSAEERDHIENQIALEREVAKQVEDSGNSVVTDNKFHLSIMLRNKYVWALMGIGFCLNIGQFGFQLWMPTAIQEITSANIMNVGLLTALPYISTVVGMWIWSAITKRIRSRRLSTALPLLFFGLFMLCSFFFGPYIGTAGNLICLCLIGSCLMGCIPSLYTLPSLALVKELDGPARGMMAFAMNLGGFVGPTVVGVIIDITGNTGVGFLFMGIMLIIGALITRIFPKGLGDDATVEAYAESLEKQPEEK